jgi:hypothetical protein
MDLQQIVKRSYIERKCSLICKALALAWVEMRGISQEG